MSRVIAVRHGPKRAVVLAGIRGPKGPAIADVEVDADGYLVVKLDDGTTVISAAPVSRPWGTIIGDISAQADLMQLLGDLEDSIPTTPAAIGAATAAQGALADTALQPADITDVVRDADPRLTDSREWSADTAPQAEAEGGTATTRRAWTAERVRQAILGWWNSATSAFGRGLVAAADAAAGRTALGLGTAAVANVTTSLTDTTAGRVSRVGDFGVGTNSFVLLPGSLDDSSNSRASGIYRVTNADNTGTWPGGGSGFTGLLMVSRVSTVQVIQQLYNIATRDWWLRNVASGSPSPWTRVFTTENLTPNVLATYTLATLPSAAANPRLQVYCSNLTGQPAPVFSDGTSWRRVSDNTIAN